VIISDVEGGVDAYCRNIEPPTCIDRWRPAVRICSFDQLRFDGAEPAGAPPGDGGVAPPEAPPGDGGGTGGPDARPGNEPSPKRRRK
ncbi:unnamed protein product, partial [Prorocentrum cordatum]